MRNLIGMNMPKRTRIRAEELVKENYPGLPSHISAMLVTRFQEYDTKYCANCSGTGSIYRVVGQGVRSNSCMCKKLLERKERSSKLFAESNIPHLYQTSSLLSWKNMGVHPNEKKLNQSSFHTIDIYSKSLSRMKDKGYGLFLCGPNGVGKTFLGCAVGNVATKAGYTVRFYTMATIIQMTIRGWFHDDAQPTVVGIRESDFLIIDDLDKIYRTKTGIETSLFDNMLRERLQRRRPCIFTSNRTLADAREDYSPSIHSMLLEQCAELVFVGQDHREGMSLDVKQDIVNGGN